MNWSDVADTVGKVAPTLGAALGGPVGSSVGTLIANVLGTDSTPEQVQAALNTDPQALAKVKAAEAQLEQARIDAATRQQETVNETMRAELAAEGWFKTSWRPAIGWMMALAFGVISIAMAIALLRDPSQLPSIMDGVITLVVAMGAVLGVNISARSNDKHVAMTGQRKPSFIDRIKK